MTQTHTHPQPRSHGPRHARPRKPGATARYVEHHTYAWSVPLVLGLVFGAYVGFLEHDGGSSPGKSTIVGLIGMAVCIGVCFLIGRAQSSMITEAKALAYGAAFGCAFGFLYALSGATVFKSAMMGLLLGVIMGVCALYVFRTRLQSR
ncbi:hypothetical protein ACMA1D_06570 [Streptomyces sp. 796.1]|uniref:hypothetical protein n=1 Tax=Streptomyces sp. 796.1 TaxID=3163029 RepID=UPI0039C91FFE